VEREVKTLPVGGECGLGGKGGAGAEDGELLVDDAQLRVGGFGVGHHRGDPAAVGAVVVEELDEADVAVRIAADWRRRVVEDLLTVGCDNMGNLASLRLTLPFLHTLKRFDENLRILDEIVTDTLLEGACLLPRAGSRDNTDSVEGEPCPYGKRRPDEPKPDDFQWCHRLDTLLPSRFELIRLASAFYLRSPRRCSNMMKRLIKSRLSVRAPMIAFRFVTRSTSVSV
jgi:hypothetical protein